MRTLLRTLTCILLATAVAGCGLVYKPPLQQGNLLDKKTVAKLKPGMTKRQVLVLMGSPSVASPFDHDRWDYVYTSSLNGGKMQEHAFTLFFNNDTLVSTKGDFFAANATQLLKQAKAYHANSSESDVKGDKSSGGDNGGSNGGSNDGSDGGNNNGNDGRH